MEVDKKQGEGEVGQGGGGAAKQQGIVPIHQALGDTLKHIHAFTH